MHTSFRSRGRPSILLVLYWLLMVPALVVAAPFDVARLEAVQVDGDLSDWGARSEIIMDPERPSAHLRLSGSFVPGDVRAVVTLGWNAEALLIGVEWLDDQRDVDAITFDTMFWDAPSGEGALDRIYLHDNLALRFFRDQRTYLYALALAPRSEGVGPYQWDMLRRGGEEDAVRTELRAARIRSTVGEDEALVIEVAVPWSKLEITPEAGLELDARLVLSDVDCTGLTLDERWADPERCRNAIRWRGAVRLQ